jgi:sulfur carrier protein
MTAQMNAHVQPTIQVNGRSEPLAAASLAALIEAKSDEIPARGIAIALNGSVVPRASWATTRLNDGDRIEIVRVMQGG